MCCLFKRRCFTNFLHMYYQKTYLTYVHEVKEPKKLKFSVKMGLRINFWTVFKRRLKVCLSQVLWSDPYFLSNGSLKKFMMWITVAYVCLPCPKCQRVKVRRLVNLDWSILLSGMSLIPSSASVKLCNKFKYDMWTLYPFPSFSPFKKRKEHFHPINTNKIL